MRITILSLVCLFAFGSGVAEYVTAEPVKFVRYPHMSNDGRIAFSYHGDIWIADQDGQNPRRLTAHIARDTFPRFSPDGKWIAFNSDRLGNGDVWVVSSTGGTPRQLTFHSTGDSVQYWTPDGQGIIVATSRGAHPWGSPLYVVPVDGGVPQPLAMDRGAAGMISQDGKTIAFNRGGFRYWRKHYRGNNNTDIWTQDLASGDIKQLTDLDLRKYQEHTQDAYPMWGADGQIYFMSERDGIFNLWKMDPQGGTPTQVTSHKTDGVQYPAIRPDGKTIVYENDFELWKLDIGGGNPQKVSIDMSFDPKENAIKLLESTNEVNDASPSATGEMVAVEYAGELFLVPTDAELGEKTRVTRSAWRDRNPTFSPDGKTLAYTSDQSGDEEIWLYDLASQEHRQLTTQPALKGGMVWSPDSRQIAYTADQKIFLAAVADGKSTELMHNPEGGFAGLSFSKDGLWLTYSRSNRDLNNEAYLFDIGNRKEFNITNSRFSEFGSMLTADGNHLVFTSDRSGSSQLYAVSLTRLTEDRDDPLVKKAKQQEKKGQADSKQEKKQQAEPEDKDPAENDKDLDQESPDGDRSQTEEDAAEADEDGKQDKLKPLDVKIDLSGIRQRARALTTGSQDIRGFTPAPDGKHIYFTRSNALYSVNIASGDEKKIADGNFRNLSFSSDGKKIFFREGAKLFHMSSAGRDKKPVEFSLKFTVNLPDQWEQIFEESWRVMKYRFYDENMHGFDWQAIRDRYKPLLKYVGENQDLYDLCNEMIGELNASHTGVSGPPTRSMPELVSTRNLGFELQDDGEYFRISHIYRNGPADKEWLDLKVGDIVLSIEGQKIRSGHNYHPLLNQLINDYVDIQVSTPGDSDGTTILGPERDLRVRHVGSLTNLKYTNWVEHNRELVDEWSDGKIGYLHIRSMNRAALEVFEREVNQFWNKNGMIIDIRYNGGGNIDQELIDILERKPYEYWNSRNGGRARGRRPRQAIAGPKVMLINWRSASDSEVTPQAFRDLQLGRIVGNPTYGAVIATSSYSLMNGARIRTPGGWS